MRLLCGIKAKQIRGGDILEPPRKGPHKSSKTVEVFLFIFGVLVVGNLLYAGICLLFGYRDEKQEFLRQTVSYAVVSLVRFSGILACDGLSKCFWPHYDTPWTRVRSITLVRKKKKNCLVLTATERTIVLHTVCEAHGIILRMDTTNFNFTRCELMIKQIDKKGIFLFTCGYMEKNLQ